MGARSKARRRALDVLFEADLRGRPVPDALADMAARRKGEGTELNPYVNFLVSGVQSHRAEIDDQLSTYAIGWTLERMPIVDRNVLRLGVFEIQYCDDVPDAVAISEAVALVTELSTDESPGFVNGLLGRIAAMKSAAGVDAEPITVDPVAIAALVDDPDG